MLDNVTDTPPPPFPPQNFHPTSPSPLQSQITIQPPLPTLVTTPTATTFHNVYTPAYNPSAPRVNKRARGNRDVLEEARAMQDLYGRVCEKILQETDRDATLCDFIRSTLNKIQDGPDKENFITSLLNQTQNFYLSTIH